MQSASYTRRERLVPRTRERFASPNRPHTRRRPRSRIDAMTWSRFCGQISRTAFVPEGRNDGSLAVYCLECVQERNRPVGYGVIGSGKLSITLSGERASRLTLRPSLRDGSFVKPIPGSKLPGYLHSVPSGQQNSPTHVHIFDSRSVDRIGSTSLSRTRTTKCVSASALFIKS